MKIRTLIVDDEPLARRGVRLYLRGEGGVEIVGECANGREAVEAIRGRKPDLVFLDVQMPLLDGFGVVEEIGVENMPAVVFVTAYDEHALRAFETGALDYLLKPLDRDRLRKTLERARARIKNPADDLNEKLSALLRSIKTDEREGKGAHARRGDYLERLVVKTPERIYFLDAARIDWIESQGNYVRVHTGRESHLLRETMDALEAKLDPAQFLRVRRSTSRPRRLRVPRRRPRRAARPRRFCARR